MKVVVGGGWCLRQDWAVSDFGAPCPGQAAGVLIRALTELGKAPAEAEVTMAVMDGPGVGRGDMGDQRS